MKYSSLAVQESPELSTQQKVRFPSGIVGFPEFTDAEIVYQEDQKPFMWLRGLSKSGSSEKSEVSFIVVEPAGLLKDYEIEITDSDVAALDLKNAGEALVLNIATLHNTMAGKAKSSKLTLNLIGPIIVNRRTLVGRQVIIGNFQKYSVCHTLFETSVETSSKSAGSRNPASAMSDSSSQTSAV